VGCKGYGKLMDSVGSEQFFLVSVSLTALLILTVAVLGWFMYRFWQLKKYQLPVRTQVDQLQTHFKQTQQANEKLVGMVKTIAHDLRSPLNAVAGLLTLLKKSPQLSTDDHELIALMERSTAHSQALTSRLLEYNYSLMEKGKSSVVNLHDFLTKLTTLTQINAFSKQQEIEFLPQGKYAASINTESMWQVIDNLISNAIKFSPQGAKIVVRLTAPCKNRVNISVIDRGIGIPPEFEKDLFKHLAKLRRAGTSGEKSFGLGLVICKQIVEAHDGTIRYESNQGRGSIFIVELPQMPLSMVTTESLQR
jgi:signal transduction histidine kinase